MRNFRWFSALLILALSACGGSSGCSTSFATAASCGGTPTPTGPVVASVLLVSDKTNIPSDNSLEASLTAYVRDQNNNFLSGVTVLFTVDTGGVSVIQAVTDANGTATAKLNTLGDPTNRTITITATADKITATASVDVTGTQIAISQGPLALTTGQVGTYTVTLNDAGAKGIGNTAVTVQPPANLTVSSTTLTTDSTGRASFTGTAGSGASGQLTVSALGVSDTKTITVSGDSLTFTAPVPPVSPAVTTIPLNTTKAFTIHWVQNGTPVPNAAINFATTRGCINPPASSCAGVVSSATVNTDGSGNATVQVLSDNAGGVTVSASAPGGASAQATANFIATVAANIEVQPDPFTLAPGEQSVISAIVRDANNNLVTGANVVFSLSDITGGVLSAPSAVTNLEGRAQTTYTAGTVSSAANGVQITASVAGSSPLVSKTVGLTVAKRQVFISIGTGNEITEPNTAQYQTDYVVQVTDSNGAGVKNVPLSMSVLSQYYFKGERVVVGGTWATCYTIPQDLANCIVGTPPASTVTLGCKDEDTNRNGILDPLENKDGINPATGTATLEAGNIAAVAPSSISTDANGFAIVSVFYPQEYAYYLQVTLQAQATVQGTAFSAQSTFLLPGSAPDFSNVKSAPPGIVSPFGTSAFCSDMN